MSRVLGASLVGSSMMFRSLDRVLRAGGGEDALRAVESVVGGVSGRVLCSVREHLANRTSHWGASFYSGFPVPQLSSTVRVPPGSAGSGSPRRRARG